MTGAITLLGTLVLAGAFGVQAEPPKDPAPAAPAPAQATPSTSPPAPAAAAPATAPAIAPPKPADPSVDQIIKDMEKASPRREDIRAVPAGQPPSPPAAASPAKSSDAGQMVQPSAPSPPAAQPPGRLLREGSVLVSRRGRMVKTRAGEWAFVFDSDGTGKADVPMILQPCLRLAEMERIALSGQSGTGTATTAEAVTFTVSGQVFVYKGRNYLLPTLAVTTRPDPNLGR
ncbi:MAG: hypothetical protein ACT4PL_08700 [Phycisphaerales bacterium]